MCLDLLVPRIGIDVNPACVLQIFRVVCVLSNLLSIAGEERIVGNPAVFAGWVSDAAQAASRDVDAAPPAGAEIEVLRTHYDAFNRRLLNAARGIYEVECSETTCGGVPSYTRFW